MPAKASLARELAEMYPDGRTFYYEGNDPAGFIAAMLARGIEPTVTVHVPAEMVAEMYEQATYPVGT